MLWELPGGQVGAGRALGLSQSSRSLQNAGDEGGQGQRRGHGGPAGMGISAVCGSPASPPPPTPDQMPRTPAEVPATGAMGKETEGRGRGVRRTRCPHGPAGLAETYSRDTKVGSFPLLFGVSPHVNMRPLPSHAQVPLVSP